MHDTGTVRLEGVPQPGKLVELFDGSGNLVASLSTDDTGVYAFHDVPPGDDYIVKVPPFAVGVGDVAVCPLQSLSLALGDLVVRDFNCMRLAGQYNAHYHLAESTCEQTLDDFTAAFTAEVALSEGGLEWTTTFEDAPPGGELNGPLSLVTEYTAWTLQQATDGIVSIPDTNIGATEVWDGTVTVDFESFTVTGNLISSVEFFDVTSQPVFLCNRGFEVFVEWSGQ